ncbi:MAG: hypothetical protein JSS02_08975 [Planctomycetes bacterium]|nr:hypothetical protein [Planctomycetota bacterium]
MMRTSQRVTILVAALLGTNALQATEVELITRFSIAKSSRRVERIYPEEPRPHPPEDTPSGPTPGLREETREVDMQDLGLQSRVATWQNSRGFQGETAARFGRDARSPGYGWNWQRPGQWANSPRLMSRGSGVGIRNTPTAVVIPRSDFRPAFQRFGDYGRGAWGMPRPGYAGWRPGYSPMLSRNGLHGFATGAYPVSVGSYGYPGWAYPAYGVYP